MATGQGADGGSAGGHPDPQVPPSPGELLKTKHCRCSPNPAASLSLGKDSREGGRRSKERSRFAAHAESA